MFIDEFLGVESIIKKDPNCFKDLQYVSEWTIWNLKHPELQVDQWKIYPCEIVPYTEIAKWYAEGTYKPYSEKQLIPLLIEIKKNIFPWIRLNRIIRDIPTDYIISSADHPNTRQMLQKELEKQGLKCKCIRCREIKLSTMPTEIIYRINEYQASNGTEYFISAENDNGDMLLGFARLRIKETQENGWLRELHVYGQLLKTDTNNKNKKDFEFVATNINSKNKNTVVQHTGIGKTLMSIAEQITLKNEKTELKVIAGEGTKNYYSKLGYIEISNDQGYMTKILKNEIK
jgi:ELP3 family radical SAM enzyme/protein acetyltransferase